MAIPLLWGGRANSRVKPKTLSAYILAYNLFITFLQLSGAPVINTVDNLDLWLLEYGEEGAKNRSVFAVAFAAVQFFHPHAKKNLVLTFQFKRGWDLDSNVRHTVPLIWNLLWGTVQALVAGNFVFTALGLLIQYGGYLRSAELLQLRTNDVVLPEFQGNSSGCFILLGMRTHGTKVRREQTAEIHSPWIIAALRFLYRNTAPGQKLINLTYARYAANLKHAWATMNLEHLGLGTHSARAGAAVNDLLNKVPFESVRERGRWLHDQSCRIYLDRAQALALNTQARSIQYNRFAQNPAAIGDIFAWRPVPPK